MDNAALLSFVDTRDRMNIDHGLGKLPVSMSSDSGGTGQITRQS
jgi:hypothetical protein